MKKLIDNLVEKIYFKRFPERAAKPITISHIEFDTVKPKKFWAVVTLPGRPVRNHWISDLEIKKRMIEAMTLQLADCIRVERQYEDAILDEIEFYGSIEVFPIDRTVLSTERFGG